jgi:hypothetical protein
MKRQDYCRQLEDAQDVWETDDFLEALSEFIADQRDHLGKVDVIVCPPYVYLEMATDFATNASSSSARRP